MGEDEEKKRIDVLCWRTWGSKLHLESVLTKMCRNAAVWIAEAMSAAAMGEAEGRGWDVKGESVIELGAGE